MGLQEMRTRHDKIQSKVLDLKQARSSCEFQDLDVLLLADTLIEHLEMELEFSAECIAIEIGG